MIWFYIILLFAAHGISLSSSQSFVQQPSPVLGFKGLQAVFKCQVTGLTNPTYQWLKDSSAVTRGTASIKDSVATLTISSLTFSDAGLYSCVARGGTTLTSSAAALTVTGRPDIIQPPSALSPHVGQTAILECISVGIPTPVISWKDSSAQPISSGGRFQVFGNGTLVISNVQKADAGYYTCKSRNTYGETTAFAEVKVLDAPALPEFTTTPANKTAKEGSDITFYCAASGVPNPSINWTRVGAAIPSDRSETPRPGALRIKNVLPSDDGIYLCVAKNSQGMKIVPVYLHIEGFPRFTVPPSDMVVTEDSSASLTCVVTGDPKPSISWTLPSGPTLTSLTSPMGSIQVLANNTLLISKVTEGHHGVYTCVARNKIGERQQRATLSVLTVPRFNTPLSNITKRVREMLDLECPSRGNPSPDHRWLFGGKIVSGTRTLSITSLNVSHQGYYMCRVNNSIGTANETFYLRVIVPPIIRIAPTNQTVAVGSTVSLPCEALGDPTPVVTWDTSRGSVASRPRHSILPNGTLVITMATQDDMGWLTCQAANAAGKVTRKAYLIVADLPVFTQLPSNETVMLGKGVILLCRASAADKPVITWYTIDDTGASHEVTSPTVTMANGDLNFTSVRREDKGMYACQACNTAGCQRTPRVHLIVLYNPSFLVPPKDVGVLKGQDALLECKPDSSPKAVITWRQPGGSVMSGTGYQQIILNVHPEKTGVYKCSAKNDYGSTGEQSITLHIDTRAVITDFSKQATNNEVLLTCDVGGRPTPNIVWYLGNITLPQNAKYPEYGVTRDSKLRVPIGSLENNTFICNASNPHAVVVYLAKVPASPTSVTVTSVTSGSMLVTWVRSSLTFLVTHYQLDMWSAKSSWTTLDNSIRDVAYPVPRLAPYTRYSFRVRAVNGLGTSVDSQPSENTTTLSSKPSVPRDLRVTVRNASVIDVTWSVPQHLHGPLADLEYRVTYQPKTPNISNEFKPGHDNSVRPQHYTIADLRPNMAYTILVRAGRRSKGFELWSADVTQIAKTRQLVPLTAPLHLIIVSNGAHQIILKWKLPPYSITGYYIWYKEHKSGEPFKKSPLPDGSATTYVILDLKENTEHEIRIQMYSNSGVGPLSTSQIVKTEVDTFNAGYSKADKGLSWKIAVGGLVGGLLLLIVVIALVCYCKKSSLRHRNSFRVSSRRSRPVDYLVRPTGSNDSGSQGGHCNNSIDTEVDLDMFEHGNNEAAAAGHDERQVQYIDPSRLDFGYDVMREVAVGTSKDQNVREDPNHVEEHGEERDSYTGHGGASVYDVPRSDSSPSNTESGFPVYTQVNMAAKKRYRLSHKDPEVADIRSIFHEPSMESIPQDDFNQPENTNSEDVPAVPTYASVDYSAKTNRRSRRESDLDDVPALDNTRGSPEPHSDNVPLPQVTDVPLFPERKTRTDTLSSDISGSFPLPPPPLENLTSMEGSELRGNEWTGRRGSKDSDTTPASTPENRANNVSSGTFGNLQNNVPVDPPPPSNGPKKRRMVASWADDPEVPMDSLWEQLDKELDKRLGT